MSTNEMHRYVLGWAGLMAAVAITLPIGIMRVSSTPKFTDQALNSYDCAGQRVAQRTVTSFWECFQLKVEPLQSKK